ncbi:1-deoxy-D-xylulose-5-phosphate synthase N-terminal domain-containing protein [Streptomyces sp. WZ-12]|uniref:1-deoxy-D-xylulose-5-phosphate synthase N-terminal domain-containing protein n=1 Tax=Streptomyces sp. WZ-12 TaxID=3030210 RepID=UPI003157F6AE
MLSGRACYDQHRLFRTARHTPLKELCSLGSKGLAALAGSICAFLGEKVTAAGGHLGANLGVAELVTSDEKGIRLVKGQLS